MDKRVAAIGGVLLVVGGGIATAAYTVGSPSWHVVSHRPTFWIGLAVAAFGAVMGIVGVLPSDTEIPEEHRTILRDTVRRIDGSVTDNTRINYGDPANGPERRKAAFETHYRKSKPLLEAVREWDRAVHALNMAEAQLHTHLHIRKDELGIQVPAYDGDLIVETFQEWTVGRARRNELSNEIGINWVGFGDELFPGPGSTSAAWVTVQHVDGESDDEGRNRATERRTPVDQLLREAQTWPEVLQIGPLWKRVRELKTPTHDAIQPALIRETFRTDRRCPFCKENRR
jgi:hypothetical protein